MTATYIVGDVFQGLATLEPGSVDLVVTSPPFLAVRTYLPVDDPLKHKEIGSEPNPAVFIDVMLDLVEAIAPALAPHGSMCLEFGDTYAGSSGTNVSERRKIGAQELATDEEYKQIYERDIPYRRAGYREFATSSSKPRTVEGWPLDKSKCMIPELIAIALAYGFNPLTGRTTDRWRIRNLVTWCRPNPPIGADGDKFRPASTRIIVATKAKDRYFDGFGVRVPSLTPPREGYPVTPDQKMATATGGSWHMDRSAMNGETRPLYDWWEIPTESFKGSHYATYPRSLVEPLIVAMCPERVCGTCGQPSLRVMGDTKYLNSRNEEASYLAMNDSKARMAPGVNQFKHDTVHHIVQESVGWSDCGHDNWRLGRVLDPFAGSGTTLLVTCGLGRESIGIDLDHRNLTLAQNRIGMFLQNVIELPLDTPLPLQTPQVEPEPVVQAPEPVVLEVPKPTPQPQPAVTEPLWRELPKLIELPDEFEVVRRHPLAKCEECPLANEQSIFVPSKQVEDPHIVIVGEAPGAQEAKHGIPFVGPSGKILDAVLAGQRLQRKEAFITNACLCRPKDNATPTAKAVRACAPRLLEEVTEATKGGAPIVAMGNVAASAILDYKVSILEHRMGLPKESHLYPGVPVIPTIHPAYALRVPEALPLLVDDIAKINGDVGMGWEEPQYRTFEVALQARQALQQLRKLAPASVVVDIEVGAEKDETFIRPDKLRLLCVGLAYAPGKAIVIGEQALHDLGVQHELSALLRSSRVVAHNGKFDLAGLRHITTGARLGFDTMLASYVCDERKGTHGLKYLAMERLGAPNYATLIHKYISSKGENFAHVPTEVLHKYNAYDVVCTWSLMELYEERMRREDLTKVHDMLVRGSNMLLPVEQKGLRVDLEYMHKLDTEFSDQIEGLDRSIRKWVENARSPQQITNALRKLGMNAPSTGIEVLQKLVETATGPALEFLTQLMEHRRLSKLHGTYVKGIEDRLENGYVHPTFLLHGTTTGRLSCRNPNLQNIPRESAIKRMFVPDPGKVFVQADYKAIELRVITCESRDEYLRSMFAEDRDIHSEVAERFFGPGFTKEQRVWAKGVVYGLSYGREAYALGQAAGIPTAEAQTYIDTFLGMIPGAMAWRDRIAHQVLETDQDLTTVYGRHRRVLLLTDENKKDTLKESYAFIPQSTASDICLSAAIELHEKHGLDIRLLVHDSILVETDEPDEVATLMHEVMPRVAAETYSSFVPFPVETAVGTNWSEV